MRYLSRLCSAFAGFWILAVAVSAPSAFAHSQSLTDHATRGFAPPAISELTIVRSSRKDVPDSIAVETAEIPEELPRILDPEGAERLMRNEGVTLQWIGWESRGPAWVAVADTGHWLLTAGQRVKGAGTLDLEGFIIEIGKDYFIFEGTIVILGAPDEDRLCRDTKPWWFEVTQNRSYYRLREFNWCDGLTDYIDVYFDPALR